MSDLTFRSLHPDDLDRVAQIDSHNIGRPRKGFFEKRLAIAMAVPDGFVTCAALEGENLVGYGFARLQEGDFGISEPVAVLDVIGVDPAVQGRGIGKAVISGIEQRMKKKGVGVLRTHVLWTDHQMASFFSSIGFKLAPSQVIERDTSPLKEEPVEVNRVKMDGVWRVHSSDGSDDFDSLSRDRYLVRSLKEDDLATVVRIDSKFTGLERTSYYQTKFREMLIESGIRVSLVAEDFGVVAGFIMARVDYGEFGKAEQAAVIDTIGVHPAYKGAGIGRALLSQLLMNLANLKVEMLRTQVFWKDFDLQRFLMSRGFQPSQRLVLIKEVG
jgi:ribosomal protein S18 acetylase RimI-like enzyme